MINTLLLESLKGKNVVITGASTGIGEQLAYHYARLGANVVITARREQRLKEVHVPQPKISSQYRETWKKARDT